jgi:hypothetical protein
MSDIITLLWCFVIMLGGALIMLAMERWGR